MYLIIYETTVILFCKDANSQEDNIFYVMKDLLTTMYFYHFFGIGSESNHFRCVKLPWNIDAI